MKWNLLLPVLLLPGLLACGDKDDDDDGDDDCADSADCDDGTGTTGTGTTGTGGGTPSVSVDWGSSAVSVSVSGGGGGWWFGIAETLECSDCWTGEDCVYGYSFDGGALNYCHDAGDSGTSLTYGGDPVSLSSGTTVFPSGEYGSRVTYFLDSDPEFGGNGACYVWGQDTSYYDGLGCTSL